MHAHGKTQIFTYFYRSCQGPTAKIPDDVPAEPYFQAQDLVRVPFDRFAYSRRIQENNLIPFKVFESVNQQLLFNLACGGDGASIITPLGLYDHIIHYGSLPQECHCMKLNGVEKHVMSLVMRSDIIQPQYNIDMADEICKEFERFMKTIDGLFAK